jgi:hypothetical protein
MIDRKTRKKIIKLKEDGYSNAEIKKKTGVSVPTVRKILREEGFEKIQTKPSQTVPLEGLIEEFGGRLAKVEHDVEDDWRKPQKHLLQKFTVNFVRVLPYSWATGNVWKVLSQGVAHWDYLNYLGVVFSSEVVSLIDEKIQAFNPLIGKIFGVRVFAIDGIYDVDVDLLLNEY